jgi:hypothetical protein
MLKVVFTEEACEVPQFWKEDCIEYSVLMADFGSLYAILGT